MTAEAMVIEQLRPGAQTHRLSGELKCFYRSGTCDEVVLTDEYQNSRFFASEYHPREDHVILDIGAHIGVFSLLAAAKARRGRVYSIEASEQNYRYLRANVEANGLANINTYLLALTDHRGTARLYSATENWAHSLCAPAADTWTTVAATTLTDFLTENSIHQIDYMKVNVEGAEYGILLGTPKTVMSKIRLMLVEFHPSEEHDLHDLIRHLQGCGFRTRIRACPVEAGKGWIVAASDC